MSRFWQSLLLSYRPRDAARHTPKSTPLAFSPDGKRLAVVKLDWRDANVPGKLYAAHIHRTISLIDADEVTPIAVIDREFYPGNYGPAIEFLRQASGSLAFSDDGDSLVFS